MGGRRGGNPVHATQVTQAASWLSGTCLELEGQAGQVTTCPEAWAGGGPPPRHKLTAPPKPKALARMSGIAVRRQGPTDRSSRNRVRKRRDRNGSQPSNGSAASKEEIGTSPPSLGNSRAARCWVAPDRVLQANPVLGRRRTGKPRGVRAGKCKCQQAGGVGVGVGCMRGVDGVAGMTEDN